MASIYNAGVFAHGGVLVRSHAYGALLNSLGVRSARNYQTHDVDIGTSGSIPIAIFGDRSFLDVLRDSGLRFLEVPELDWRKAATPTRVMRKPLNIWRQSNRFAYSDGTGPHAARGRNQRPPSLITQHCRTPREATAERAHEQHIAAPNSAIANRLVER
ncbi:GSU2403 family nucleotidyltransferase fold protein [Paraburkholderia youngii]|uniref:GSU2403 family nucleotidyltransferase fold protein n=1 Tax=Paraburkholderia youngii TaxID=2782701 RepID=UPI003D20BAF0